MEVTLENKLSEKLALSIVVVPCKVKINMTVILEAPTQKKTAITNLNTLSPAPNCQPPSHNDCMGASNIDNYKIEPS